GLAPAKVTIDNVKRGELNLEGSVRGVDAEILLATNNSNWQNSFDVVGSTVDDTITVGRGSFEGQQLANFGEAVVDGSVSTITADLGDGYDTFDASASLAVSDVDGGAGDDTIIGSGGNDMLSGGEGNDTIDGGEGDDTIDGGAGENTIDGGEGDDTLLLAGLVDAFELVNNNGTIEITEIATGDISTAVGVETFTFSDGTTVAVEDVPGASAGTEIFNDLIGPVEFLGPGESYVFDGFVFTPEENTTFTIGFPPGRGADIFIGGPGGTRSTTITITREDGGLFSLAEILAPPSGTFDFDFTISGSADAGDFVVLVEGVNLSDTIDLRNEDIPFVDELTLAPADAASDFGGFDAFTFLV
ncbi:MAG: hypothetical protein AAGK37_23945, partial [Pseudomonadota bacterium]